MTLVALVLAAALNPLVVRSPEPHGNVPANCEVSDAPAAPRAVAAAASQPEDPGAPLPPVRRATPAQGEAQTRFDVRPLQQAIAANDRARFDAELARARAAGVPTRVYEDVGRLWDAQFESPFFAEDSEAHRIASQYPGYEAAVREQIFTDASGRKFYPASESKAFVARQTGVNLPAATRSRTTTTTTTQQPSNRATPQPTTRATQQPRNRVTQQPSNPATQQPTPQKTSPNPRTPATRPQTPAARKDSAPPRRSPDPLVAQKPAAAVPAPVVPPVENTSSTAAPPAAGSLPVDPIATTTTDPLITGTTATDTVATGTTATDTATGDTVATGTTTTTTTTPAAQTGRSIILPAILILIGLGVLFLLFRAK